MDLIKKIIKHPRFIKFLCAGIAVVIISGVTAYFLGLDLDQIWNTAKDVWAFVSTNKWALFLAIVILPALPFPMSVLLGAVGVAWSDMPIHQACALAMVGVTLNMTWTYFVAAYPARKLIDKWLKLTKFKIPELGRRDYIGLIFLLRATPGIPLFIHNYILGFLRVPFFVYLPMSILITGCYVVGIIVTSSGVASSATGDGTWQDNIVAIGSGIGLLILAGFITKFIRKAYTSKKSEVDKEALIEKDKTEATETETIESASTGELVEKSTDPDAKGSIKSEDAPEVQTIPAPTAVKPAAEKDPFTNPSLKDLGAPGATVVDEPQSGTDEAEASDKDTK